MSRDLIKQLIPVFGIVLLMLAGGLLAACSPDDSAIIQTQTQDAKNAFSTRVAAAHQNLQATTAAQDLISALSLLSDADTAEFTPNESVATLPSSGAAPTVQANISSVTFTPTALIPTATLSDLLATNTPAPTSMPAEMQTAPTVTATVATAAMTQPASAPTTTNTITIMPTLVPSTTLDVVTSTLPSQPSGAETLTPGITVFAAFDDGVIDHLTTTFTSLGQHTAGADGAIDIDGMGNLYIGNTTNVLVLPEICSATTLPPGDAVDVNAGLADIQGLKSVSAPGRLLVVDSSQSAPALVAIARNEQNALIVVFRTSNLAGKRPWDLDYDATNDRLYVTTTDGNVLVFDNYLARRGEVPPTRIITPFDPSGAQQVSVDLHGIVYVPSSDTLILSDVGGTVDPNDGQILLIDHASAANGNVPVRAQIRGADTYLGDPTDLAFDGTSLYVAENFNGFLLRYDNILSRSGVLDLAANGIASAPHVRSVALALENPAANPVCSQVLPAVTTSLPSQLTQESAASPAAATRTETSPPPTQNAASQIPVATSVLPTSTPPPATQIPTTPQPASSTPLTPITATPVTPTQPPPTATPLPTSQTPPSATPIPPTQPPTATAIPATPVPPTPTPTS